MGPLVPLVMYGWIPAVLYLFSRFPPQRAVVISFITAWLFLPQASYQFTGIPNYTKMSATCYGILLATILFDGRRLTSFKPAWIDIPMIIWCICPIASSLSNNLGLYDGLSAALSQTVEWGFPYFLGRIYLKDLAGLTQLAQGIFIGGLIYVPLCLYEIRMSPQLHSMVYGFRPTSWNMVYRLGGFRPTVFMRHGLSVGMWMMAASLIGIWLWQSGKMKQLWGIEMKWLVGALVITFLLIRSTGAYFYLGIGIAILMFVRWFRSSLLLLLVIAGISSYVYLGASGEFAANFDDQVVAIATQLTNEERASSLEFRYYHEEMLGEKARSRPLFGWGGWGRNRVYGEDWQGNVVDISVTDSLWIIAFGVNGAVGLISVTSALLLPPASFALLGYPGRLWLHPQVAPAAGLAIVVTLYMLDSTLNNQPNPVYALAAGGLAGLVIKETQPRTAQGKTRAISTKKITAIK